MRNVDILQCQQPSINIRDYIFTLSFISLAVPKLEQNHLIRLHFLLVEPSLIVIIQYFVRLVSVMRKDDISGDQIFLWIKAAIIAKCEWAVLVWRSNGPPDTIAKGSVSLGHDWLMTGRHGTPQTYFRYRTRFLGLKSCSGRKSCSLRRHDVGVASAYRQTQ